MSFMFCLHFHCTQEDGKHAVLLTSKEEQPELLDLQYGDA